MHCVYCCINNKYKCLHLHLVHPAPDKLTVCYQLKESLIKDSQMLARLQVSIGYTKIMLHIITVYNSLMIW